MVQQGGMGPGNYMGMGGPPPPPPGMRPPPGWRGPPPPRGPMDFQGWPTLYSWLHLLLNHLGFSFLTFECLTTFPCVDM